MNQLPNMERKTTGKNMNHIDDDMNNKSDRMIREWRIFEKLYENDEIISNMNAKRYGEILCSNKFQKPMKIKNYKNSSRSFLTREEMQSLCEITTSSFNESNTNEPKVVEITDTEEDEVDVPAISSQMIMEYNTELERQKQIEAEKQHQIE